MLGGKPVMHRAFTGVVGMPPDTESQNAHVETQHSAPKTSPTSPLVKTRVLIPADVVYCLAHAKRHPCLVCVQDELRAREHRERAELLQRFNLSLALDVAAPAIALPPTHVVERNAIAQRYNVDKYRKEINLALKHARILLRGFAARWRDASDLKQIVDIEIWKAVLHYQDRMTPELAYTIAKNQAKKFLKQQRGEQSSVVTTPDGPMLDEFGEPRRVNRFESFDDKGSNEDGEPRETSRVEEQIVLTALPPDVNPALDKLTRDIPLLQHLVAGWFGAKRIVGQVLLRTPDATVRDFPGVPKTTASRVRKVVLAEFRKALLGGVGQDDELGTYKQ
jgi:DNA-directed RNA polymerase specialized sigma24 family protein